MGKVFFIGAGPGAADLITVRGARLLGQADVVLFDALTDPGLRALAPHANWIDVGKRGFGHATRQTQIDAMLVREAQQHACVVRLKGGDPSLFGRLEEELEALAARGIACEVVPGVTAALAAAACAQRPLTRRGRGRSVAFSTAMTQQGELRGALSADSEVFYMAGRQLGALSRRLRAAGWPAHTPACVVSRAGCSDGQPAPAAQPASGGAAARRTADRGHGGRGRQRGGRGRHGRDAAQTHRGGGAGNALKSGIAPPTRRGSRHRPRRCPAPPARRHPKHHYLHRS